MLAVEQSRRHQLRSHPYDHETGTQLAFDMNAYTTCDSSSTYASLPYSYWENSALFVEAPLEDTKYDLNRSISSTGSFHHIPHIQADHPLSLISSTSGPSLPSASSSTVGSPHSGHSHPVSAPESWISAGHFSANPVIVNHEDFGDFSSGIDIGVDHSFVTPGKLPDDFVGECADLSSFSKRSSAFPTNNSFQSPSSQQRPPFSSSPEPMSIERFGANNRAASAASAVDSNPFLQSSVARIKKESDPSTRSDGVFKSPTTPASARSRTPSTCSPVAARATKAASKPVVQGGAPTSYPTPSSPATSPMQQHASQFQTHFFSQSSGNFMPPLESSYPSLIQGPHTSFAETQSTFTAPIYPQQPYYHPVMSPAASPAAYNGYQVPQQYPSNPTYSNYPHAVAMERRPSMSSYHSGISHHSPLSSDFDDDTKEKRCPYTDCGRIVKDLKAHIITHQSERPEKCPILHCEYNQKGFARKYDKNRHTLTHYKGTMVCGFCPGSGSAAEKSFNRADVFKRHLTSVHGVEQTPPNSRKRSPGNSSKKLSSYCQDATGKCSTCSATFNNAQDFYEHLDDCVLRVVQQEEDSEAVNAMQLGKMSSDTEVKETLERHMLNPSLETSVMPIKEEEDDDDDDEDDDEDESDFPSGNDRSGRGNYKSKVAGSSRPVLSGGITKSTRPAKKGLTHSKGGVALVGKGRKKRKHYPPSWGMSADKMQMKKRVLCVYEGERRLWKDDLMMHNEFEVRMKLGDGKSYVTDLDVETLKRAEAIHNATEEDKGPWMPEEQDHNTPLDLEALMAWKDEGAQ